MTETTPTPPAHTTPAAPETVILDHHHAWDTLTALQRAIGQTDWEVDLADEKNVLGRLARDAAVLSQLASAIRARPDGPSHHEAPIVDPAALRERLTIILTESDESDPHITLSGDDMWGFVVLLQQAVADFDIRAHDGMTTEAGNAFYRLADRARALATAASGVGSHVHRRADAMGRVRATIAREEPREPAE